MDERTGDGMDGARDTLGRAQRVYHTHTPDADAYADLGARGSIGSVAYAWDTRRGGYNVLNARASEPMTFGRERAVVRYAYDAPTIAPARRGTLADTFYGIRAVGRDATVLAHNDALARRRVVAFHNEHALGALSCDDASYHTQTERVPERRERERVEHIWGMDLPRALPLTERTRTLLARANTIGTDATRERNARERDAWTREFDARIASRA